MERQCTGNGRIDADSFCLYLRRFAQSVRSAFHDGGAETVTRLDNHSNQSKVKQSQLRQLGRFGLACFVPPSHIVIELNRLVEFDTINGRAAM